MRKISWLRSLVAIVSVVSIVTGTSFICFGSYPLSGMLLNSLGGILVGALTIS